VSVSIFLFSLPPCRCISCHTKRAELLSCRVLAVCLSCFGFLQCLKVLDCGRRERTELMVAEVQSALVCTCVSPAHCLIVFPFHCRALAPSRLSRSVLDVSTVRRPDCSCLCIQLTFCVSDCELHPSSAHQSFDQSFILLMSFGQFESFSKLACFRHL
jgi:hypothetical protein